jgi:hypothetical protein
VLFFLDLTPTLYWDTPLSDPLVRAWLVTQMICSAALIVVWFPLRRAVGRARPDLLEAADRFIERYGLLILVAIPILQHLIGHGVFGYNLQPTDGRYTYMDWGRAMLERGVIPFLSRGLLRRMETPLIGGVWALFYGVTGNGYVASALVPMVYFEVVIVGTYLLARELLGRGVAFYAGLFLALSPLFSYASYFVMSDVPSAAMTVLTLWVFAVALKRESVPLAVASGICLFLATITKLTAVYGAFLMLVVYFLSASRSKKILLVSLAFVVLLPIAYVAPYFLSARAVCGGAGGWSGASCHMGQATDVPGKRGGASGLEIHDPGNGSDTLLHGACHPAVLLSVPGERCRVSHCAMGCSVHRAPRGKAVDKGQGDGVFT